MDRAAAAEGVQDEVARIVPARDRHAADLVLHQAVGDHLDARGALEQPEPETLAQRAHRGARGVDVEPHPAAEEVLGVEQAEHEVGVRDGRHRAAAAVADGAGIGPRALRPDAERARLRVDPGEAAAARADRLDVDHAQEQVVLLDHDAIAHRQPPAVDHADVERRAAHVGGDDVRVARLGARARAGDDAADRPRLERHDRALDQLLGVDQAAVALREQQPVAVPAPPQLGEQRRHVVAHQRADVRVDHGRRGARVLADALREPRAVADVDVGPALAQQRVRAVLVDRVEVAPEVADRQRVDALAEQPLDGRLHLAEIERHDDLAEGVDPLRHLDHVLAPHEALRERARGVVEDPLHGLAVGAARVVQDAQRVAVPDGRDQPDARAGPGDDGVDARPWCRATGGWWRTGARRAPARAPPRPRRSR